MMVVGESGPSDWLGAVLASVTGSETVHTQNIWYTQNLKTSHSCSLRSSKRRSSPHARMRSSRKIESRRPQSTTIALPAMLLGSEAFPPSTSVSTASTTKFVPPAKSVTLSNLKTAAIAKNVSW